LTRARFRPTFEHPETRSDPVKPGVTQELRSRVREHLAAEARQRRLTTAALVLAIVAACAYFVLRWLS